MKAVLPIMILVVGFASVTSVQAQDAAVGSGVKDASSTSRADFSRRPGGGWDLNNLRISVSRSKLIGFAREGVTK